MNWRKYIDKLLYNLKLKFKSKEELLTEEVLTFNFKYSDIKDINIKYEFIDKDIITSIQKIRCGHHIYPSSYQAVNEQGILSIQVWRQVTQIVFHLNRVLVE